MNSRIPRVLSVAGTDPTGGAGIQADLKSIAANGGYGMAVVTALVAQNTRGVRAVHVPPVAFLSEQLNAVSDDIAIDAVKIGMLAEAAVIGTVDEWLRRIAPPVVVLDPVMVATSGDRLLDADAEHALRRLARHAHLVTPNIPELAVLTGADPAETWDGVLEQAQQLASELGILVLAKGGHAAGPTAPDALVAASGVITEFTSERIATANTHGTGCSLSSALATLQPQTGDWAASVAQAKRWLTECIRRSDELKVGRGNGPINHFAALWSTARDAEAASDRIAAEWWNAIADIRQQIDALPFISGLVDGSLDDGAFRHYLTQDTLYLRDYARVLSTASALAASADEQEFWAEGARSALVSETAAVHNEFLGTVDNSHEKSPTCAGYLDHLLATSARGDYRVLIAAALPCYWIYADTGTRMLASADDGTRYLPWLALYGDAAFSQAAERAIRIVTRHAAAADEQTLARMWQAFRRSAEHELAFFTAPLHERETVDSSG